MMKYLIDYILNFENGQPKYILEPNMPLFASIGMADTVMFDTDVYGGIFVVLWNAPTEFEINELRTGTKEIRIKNFENVTWLTLKIGLLSWIDAPFTLHLSKLLVKENIYDYLKSIRIAVIDTSMGYVVDVVNIPLSENDTNILADKMMSAYKLNFSPVNYAISLNEIKNKYTIQQIADMSESVLKTENSVGENTSGANIPVGYGIDEDGLPYKLNRQYGWGKEFNVFVTQFGQYYHKSRCSYVRGKEKTVMHRYQAIRNGKYKPCPQCKPKSYIDDWYESNTAEHIKSHDIEAKELNRQAHDRTKDINKTSTFFVYLIITVLSVVLAPVLFVVITAAMILSIIKCAKYNEKFSFNDFIRDIFPKSDKDVNTCILLGFIIDIILLICFVAAVNAPKDTTADINSYETQYQSPSPTTKTYSGTSANIKTTDITVYVTSSGEKYHRKSCRYIAYSTNTHTITLDKAKRQGYKPCDVCDPPR